MDVHRMQIDGFDAEGYRRRLRLLRRLHGMNQTKFAKFVGIPYKQWNHYERGYPISRETQFVLHFKLGSDFSVDWLFWGEVSKLTPDMAEQIRALEQQIHKRKPAPRPKVRKRISKTDKSV
jgi:transcriptional regulator with XRE-family HTH domain